MVSPSESTTSTGSAANSVAEYCENAATTVFRTIFALFRSVAVHSMNTSVVSRVMALCAPLINGGNDKTVRFASYSTGNTALPSRMCRKCFSFWSLL